MDECHFVLHPVVDSHFWLCPFMDQILWKDGVPPPLAHLYRCEGEDFKQNIWD
jgi:hypothetical protein